MGHNIAHTVCTRGKRVAIGLKNGQLVTGKFVKRANNNRWVEVDVLRTLTHPCGVTAECWEVIRIPRAEIESFSVIKGQLSLKRLGRKGA